LIIFLTVGLGVVMAGAAWWYRWQESRRAAAFWGEEVGLLTNAPKVELLEFGGEGEEKVAGRAVKSAVDLSEKHGLIHLRFVFAEDANFEWDQQRREAVNDGTAWAHALRFVDGERRLVVLFSRDFDVVGKLEGDGEHVHVVPIPKAAAAIRKYLTDIGAIAGR
jgi:hypothetical protein